MPKAWMVRAERNGRLYEKFKDDGVVAIGWHEIGSLDTLKTREAIADRVRATWPETKPQAIAMAAGQIHRFRNEIQVADQIVTYDPSRRVYLLGEVTGDYRRDESFDSNDKNLRAVRWEGEVSRDLLGVESKNTLGSISTLFILPDSVIADLRRALQSKSPPPPMTSARAEVADEEDIFRNIQSKALEFTKDRVSALDWEEMQELVAGLLRAMGYKTQISPAGPDRGKDIVASPDGFGFQAPKIIVEVKHRQGAIGAPAVRSFIGGHRHAQDRGLYVSTGGFTREAYYEAERSNVPLALMTIDDLVEALIEHYDRLDIETKQLLPLKRIYWAIVAARPMSIASSIVGFDSAWTDNPKAPGAVCVIRIDPEGRAHFVEPELASFGRALQIIRVEQANSPHVLVALDQPTIVTNATGSRPVERVVASYISWIGGGVQPSNRGRTGMFDDAAPIWTFKTALGAVEDPEQARDASEGLFIMEVFPALALPGFFSGFSARLGGPRYNPARRKTFKMEHWARVASLLSELGGQHEIAGLADWCRDHGAKTRPGSA